jgi:glycosyltransferase involved in cell wall biosynthesis
LLPPDRYRASIVTFWAPSDGRFLSQYPCPVHVFSLARSWDWNGWKTAARLSRLIRAERVAITQTFFATSDLWGAPIAKLSGCPVVVSSRRDLGFGLNARHRLAYRLLAPLFDRVHTVSDAVRDYTVRENRIRPDHVITIPNGVDMDRIPLPRDKAYARASHGLADASHLILDVGTIKPVKGFDVLVRTAEIVCRRYPKAVFLIVGRIVPDGYIDQLRNLIASLGLTGNFRFPGHFDNVFPWLQMCDVFCHLSRSDGLSNALLEAMACGLPSIATGVGGNPEVLEEDRSGFLVPVERPGIAADRILTLLDNPDRAAAMGDCARRRIQRNYTAESMVRRLVELYDELLASKRTS